MEVPSRSPERGVDDVAARVRVADAGFEGPRRLTDEGGQPIHLAEMPAEDAVQAVYRQLR